MANLQTVSFLELGQKSHGEAQNQSDVETKNHPNMDILVGGLVAINFIFPLILGISFIIPIDELHHFSEGWPNHQPEYVWVKQYQQAHRSMVYTTCKSCCDLGDALLLKPHFLMFFVCTKMCTLMVAIDI